MHYVAILTLHLFVQNLNLRMLTLKVPIILIIDILQENKSLLEMHMYLWGGVAHTAFRCTKRIKLSSGYYVGELN